LRPTLIYERKLREGKLSETTHEYAANYQASAACSGREKPVQPDGDIIRLRNFDTRVVRAARRGGAVKPDRQKFDTLIRVRISSI